MSDFTSSSSFPKTVQVSEVISSRYAKDSLAKTGRPFSWDERKAGIDKVRLVDGSVVELFSEGQQSTPAPGWVILLTGGNQQSGYQWTLYGLPANQ